MGWRTTTFDLYDHNGALVTDAATVTIVVQRRGLPDCVTGVVMRVSDTGAWVMTNKFTQRFVQRRDILAIYGHDTDATLQARGRA